MNAMFAYHFQVCSVMHSFLIDIRSRWRLQMIPDTFVSYESVCWLRIVVDYVLSACRIYCYIDVCLFCAKCVNLKKLKLDESSLNFLICFSHIFPKF